MLRWGVPVGIQAQQGLDFVVLRDLWRRFCVCSHVPWGHPQCFAAVKPKTSLLACSYSSLLACRQLKSLRAFYQPKAAWKLNTRCMENKESHVTTQSLNTRVSNLDCAFQKCSLCPAVYLHVLWSLCLRLKR